MLLFYLQLHVTYWFGAQMALYAILQPPTACHILCYQHADVEVTCHTCISTAVHPVFCKQSTSKTFCCCLNFDSMSHSVVYASRDNVTRYTFISSCVSIERSPQQGKCPTQENSGWTALEVFWMFHHCHSSIYRSALLRHAALGTVIIAVAAQPVQCARPNSMTLHS